MIEPGDSLEQLDKITSLPVGGDQKEALGDELDRLVNATVGTEQQQMIEAIKKLLESKTKGNTGLDERQMGQLGTDTLNIIKKAIKESTTDGKTTGQIDQEKLTQTLGKYGKDPLLGTAIRTSANFLTKISTLTQIPDLMRTSYLAGGAMEATHQVFQAVKPANATK